MKRLFVYALLFFLFLPNCIVLNAQNDQNGQQIKGGWTVETTTIYEKEVKKKVKEKKVHSRTEKGYQQSITISSATEFENCIKLGVDYIGGYRFNEVFYLGAGIGLNYNFANQHEYCDYHDDDYGNGIRNPLSIPLYLNLRTYLGKQHKFFLALSTGCEFGVIPTELCEDGNSEYSDLSFFAEPMLGWSVPLSSRSSLDFQIGLKLHSITDYDDYMDEYKISLETDLAVKIGFTF